MAKSKRHEIKFNRESMIFDGINELILKNLKDTFKGVDVEKELKKMGLWLSSPKGKKRKGNLAFITNWLDNCTPDFSNAPKAVEQIKNERIDSEINEFVENYLVGLWKDCTTLLMFNTKTA